MGPRWTTYAFVAAVLGCASVNLVSARDCFVGTEPDQAAGGEVRLVLPLGDPCTCTEFSLGGHNTYAPLRVDPPPQYLDVSALGLMRIWELRSSLFSCAVGGSTEDFINNLQGSSTPPNMETTTEIPSSPKVTTAAPESTPAATTTVPESTPMATTTVSESTPAATTIPPVPATDCQEILDSGHTDNGVYTIHHAGNSMQVYCQMDNGKGYIVFQRRVDGTVDFHRNWNDYAHGFGNPEGEFWLGNEKLKSLTESAAPEAWELVITLTSFDGEVAHAHYNSFSITGDKYTLDANGYEESAAGDALTDLHLREFTTHDEDNDASGPKNCAEEIGGGWWFKKCNSLASNLNGRYSDTESVAAYEGIQWVTWKGFQTSMKGCEMKMRRTQMQSSH